MAAANATNKYLMQDKDGNYLEKNPDEVIKRLTKEFARIEQKYPNPLSEAEIYDALKGFKKIIAQGSPMFGIGNDEQITSIGNCFVIPGPEDSYGGILKTDHDLVQVMKRRGGVGVDISSLRPSGCKVNNAAKSSDGIGLFMERFSNTTKEVAQNGRRGALMLSISCMHPDIETFINIKKDLTNVTGANISIRWTDEFLNAVENDEQITLRYPVEATLSEATTTKEVSAVDIWTQFVSANHAAAEPGCLFWDTILKDTISEVYAEDGFKTSSVNPCGEIILSPYGACILMVVNLANIVPEYLKFKDIRMKDLDQIYANIEKHTRIATRLMDDMIDLEIEKVDKIIDKISQGTEHVDLLTSELTIWLKIKETYEKGRRIGLGVTGLGDLIAQMGFKYGDNDSINFTDRIFKIFKNSSYYESAMLAKERGTFEVFNYEKEKDHSSYGVLDSNVVKCMETYGRRNIAINTCAPAGTISTLAQASSGIEPVFMLSYLRNKKMTQEELDQNNKPAFVDNDGVSWSQFEVVHHGLEEWRRLNPGIDDSESPYFGCTAQEINWENRVKMQSTIQKYIDHSISSTVNLPKEATLEEINGIYLEAWKQGCKGITIYRDGSRTGVLVSKEDKDNNESAFCLTCAPKREKSLGCDIHYSNVMGKSWIFFVGLVDGRPYDVFGGKQVNIEISKKWKKGIITKNGRIDGVRTYDLVLGDDEIIIKDIAKEFSPDLGANTRLLSTMLRHGIPIKFICEQLNKIGEDADLFCFEKSVARVLKKYIKDGEKAGGICPECEQDAMAYRDGCISCMSCGWSKCG